MPEMTGQPGLSSATTLAGTCVVLGAHGEIGSAVVRAFSRAGARVVGADVRPGPGVVACDVRDEDAVMALFAQAAKSAEIRYVVHAAGTVAVGPVAQADIPSVRALLEVNLVSCFVTAKVALRCLSSGHSLTFIASHAALHGAAEWAAYGASKAGVVNLAQALAQEAGPHGVRVNSVSPGSVLSPMMEEVLNRAAAERELSVDLVRAEAERSSPLGRFATPDEIASVCVFLASPAAAYVSGANIVVNGGERPG